MRAAISPLRKEQFNLNQFGCLARRSDQERQDVLFPDYQAKMQRHGIPFVGLIPTAAMKTGDYSLDPFGRPNTAQLTNPFTFSPFQCDGAGNPNPALADGSQAPGVNCNKIPANMIDPVGQRMINLYPVSNASNAALGFNFTSVPVRRLNEGELDARLDHNFSTKDTALCPLQLRSGGFICSRRLARIC